MTDFENKRTPGVDDLENLALHFKKIVVNNDQAFVDISKIVDMYLTRLLIEKYREHLNQKNREKILSNLNSYKILSEKKFNPEKINEILQL